MCMVYNRVERRSLVNMSIKILWALNLTTFDLLAIDICVEGFCCMELFICLFSGNPLCLKCRSLIIKF